MPGAVAGVGGLEQRAGARELHVVTVGGDGQDVEGMRSTWASARGEQDSFG